jgi:hypothetical protein
VNLFQLYKTYLHDLDKVLFDMEKHGCRIDKAAQESLRTKIEVEIAELLEKAQHVPDDVKPTKLWKKFPKDKLVQEIWVPAMVKACGKCFETITGKAAHQKGRQNPCKGATVEKIPGQAKAYIEVLPFNPLSTKQLTAYCKFYKHPVGKHMKTGNDTVNVRHLQKLEKKYGDKHGIYKLTLRIRGLQKVLSGNLYEPDANGYAHGHYKHTPSTLRLAQAGYNFMQVSKRGNAVYAKEVRKQIVPSPGCVFVEADYSALEAVLTGYFMGDDEFISLARRGIHSWLCCQNFGWEFNQESIDKIKANYVDQYDRAKITVYLSLYEGGPGMLAGTFPDGYSWETFSLAHFKEHSQCRCGRKAEEVLATTSPYDPMTKKIRPLVMQSLCGDCWKKIPAKFRFKWNAMNIAEWEQFKFISRVPKLPLWWRHTKELAQRQGYLQSPWGFKCPFYSVLRPEERENPLTGKMETVLVDGPDSNAAVNFNPQHAGGMVGREALLLFGQTWLRKFMPANGFIHDGWIFDVPEGRKSECIEVIERIMPRPIPALNGLRIGCEISVGERSWADTRTVKTVTVE